MERPRKPSKESPKNGPSKSSSKSRRSSEQKVSDSKKRKAVEKDDSDSEGDSQEGPRSAPKAVKSSKSQRSSEQKVSDSTKHKDMEKDDSDSEGDAQEASRSAPKTVKKPRISLQGEGGGNADSEDTGVKIQKNSDGERYVDLGKKKRVTVRTFKGMTLVDIREYYGNEGDEKPGKKGISLTVDQWKSLVQASTTISELV